MTAPAIDLDALLRRLHLPTVRRLYPELAQRTEQDGVSYRDYLGLLMAEEVAHRAQTRIQRCVRRAHFPFLKTIEEFDFTFQASIRLALLGSVLGPELVTRGLCLIASGPSGTGKTHLAVAIAYRAIQNGFEARFTTATALIDELSTATRKGRLRHVLPAYTHPHVLVIDEVGYLSYGPDAANVLFHVVNERYLHQRPMLFTTNKPRPSSTGCWNGAACSSCGAPPTALGTRSLTSTKTRSHHPRHRPEFPETSGQNFRNPQASVSARLAREAGQVQRQSEGGLTVKCSRCQHQNEAGAKFCEECATPMARACANCGRPLSPTAKFCPECAHPSGLSPTPPRTPRFQSPDTYTPRYLAERILTSKDAMEGERKLVTVLFADLKGSMELLADRDPEEARHLLDPVLERMMEAVHRYEGMVNQIMGDGIMALFGAPLAHEDHAVRACYAALRMQASIKRYAEDVHRTAGVPLHIRVGVNSGEVVVRSIGSDLRMDYSAVGQTTHLAARLEQMAMPGSILISPDTLSLAEGYVVVTPLGERPVKGLGAPIGVFEVMGAGTVRSRLQAAAARGLTRFVGRDPELEQLRQALEQARAGHGQVVAVVGDPGVGKSRLFWEFTHSHRTQGWLIVESSSVSYGKATAFLPLIDLLRGYFQIEARDDARKIREKVTGKLLSLDRALEPSLPALLWLLDVAVDDAQWQRLDPPQRRQQALDGIKRLLMRESQVQPLLLVFEDLHWIDAETQALLDSLVESLPTARLLLLVNYRPEYQHGWGSKTCYRQLRIDPLPREGAEELLEALVGDDPGLQPLKRLLIERTEGNPFFLEESVRTLVETKVLVGERGAYRTLSASHSLQIPLTAQAILAARIDRLAPEHKRLLQAAAVVGRDVPFALLQAITAEPEEALRSGLASLQAAEFLYEARLFPDLEYTFKHALTHDVAYGGLLQERRRALHAKILDTIEGIYPNRLTEHVERLADHAFRGEVWEKAVTYFRQAGAKAAARSSNREALAYFETAMTALTHLPETRVTRELAIDLRFDLRNSLHTLAAFGRIDGLLHEADRLATELGDQRRLGWVSAYRSGHHVHTGGHVSDVGAFAQRVETIGDALGDVPLQVAAQYYRLLACHLAGDYRGAEHGCRRLMASLPGDRAHERFGLAVLPAVHARVYLARTLAEQGMFEEGAAHGHEAMRMAQALDHPFSVLWTCLGQAYLNSTWGDMREAARLLEHAVALCRERSITTYIPVTMAALGHIYTSSGRIEEGVVLQEEAMALYESAEIGYFHSISLVHLGEAYLLAHRVEDARATADRAATLARTRGERGYEVYARRLLGDIAALSGPPRVSEAEARYRAALASAANLGMRPLAAHCHFGLGKLYRRSNDRAHAEEHLTAAIAIYRELSMRSWLEQADAEQRAPAGGAGPSSDV